MRLVPITVVFFGAIHLDVSAQSDAPPFKVAGLFSIGSPSKDYEWKLVAIKEIQGVKARFFLCAKKDDSGKMVLILEERNADSEEIRRVVVKAHWNTLVELKDRGYTHLSGTKPSLDKPIPDQVYYSISGKDPDGLPVFIRGATVFGKYIYGFQVLAPTAQEGDRLIEMVKSLKELR